MIDLKAEKWIINRKNTSISQIFTLLDVLNSENGYIEVKYFSKRMQDIFLEKGIIFEGDWESWQNAKDLINQLIFYKFVTTNEIDKVKYIKITSTGKKYVSTISQIMNIINTNLMNLSYKDIYKNEITRDLFNEMWLDSVKKAALIKNNEIRPFMIMFHYMGELIKKGHNKFLTYHIFRRINYFRSFEEYLEKVDEYVAEAIIINESINSKNIDIQNENLNILLKDLKLNELKEAQYKDFYKICLYTGIFREEIKVKIFNEPESFFCLSTSSINKLYAMELGEQEINKGVEYNYEEFLKLYVEMNISQRNYSLQSKLKAKLFSKYSKCAFCDFEYSEFLIASHIKAFKDCDNAKEAMSEHNAFLLCPTHDKMFDSYNITVDCKEFKIITKEKYIKLIKDMKTYEYISVQTPEMERFLKIHNSKFFGG
ncbi:HNH endonuclease signature motif containing protein [Spiroplasma culicicola]|nr:HNH endonuclease signature motif containing protein [Spiroplasma culicicola]